MRCDYSFVCPIHQKEIEDERKLQQQEDWNEQVLHRLTEIELSRRGGFDGCDETGCAFEYGHTSPHSFA